MVREEVQLEITACETIEGLRHIYLKYPKLQEQLMPLILKKKELLERIESQVISNNQIIQQTKNQENGIDNNK
jgi:hypothetical protein